MTNSVSNSNIFLKEIILCPKKLLYFFFIIYSFLISIRLPISATEKEDTVSVNVFNNMYYGTLEKNNDGESVFSLFSDQSDSTFTITGNWSEALIHSMVPVSFPIKMEPYRKSHSKKELLKKR